jgi:hypothetical protein
MEYKLIKKFEEQTSTAIKTNKPNELKIWVEIQDEMNKVTRSKEQSESTRSSQARI